MQLSLSPSRIQETPEALENLQSRIEEAFFSHPVITDNPYTKWFKQGQAAAEDVRDLLIQFSVFSNHFIVIQAKRMVFAASEEAERNARFILMNECGVGLDPHTGSAEGKTFTTANAHINWLREGAKILGIAPRSLGRWESAWPSTRTFLKGLDHTYASSDDSIGAGASFAIENWAAFGIGEGPEAESNNFWKELIVGLQGVNAERASRGLPEIPVGFFKYHFQLERGHAANVWQELERNVGQPGFDEEKFLKGGRLALNAIHTFWLGLDERRRRKHDLQGRKALPELETAERATFNARLNLDDWAQSAQSWAR